MATATCGRAWETGPPALLRRHAGNAVRPSASRVLLPASMRRAIALGSESQVPAATGGIAGPARTEPDDHIAANACGTGRGLWKQAEITRGDDLRTDCGHRGQRHLRQRLVERADARSGRSGRCRRIPLGHHRPAVRSREARARIRRLDCRNEQRFLKSLMFRIRFGSTTGTRFGVSVVRPEDAADAASDAARGGWTQGEFACTPSDAPSCEDIPDRGGATFRGSAVAAAPGIAREQEGATLYAGKKSAHHSPHKYPCCLQKVPEKLYILIDGGGACK